MVIAPVVWIPHRVATERAVRTLSPVHILVVTGVAARGDDLTDTRAEGVFDTVTATGVISRGKSRKRPRWETQPNTGRGSKTVAERDGPQHLVGVGNDRPLNDRPPDAVVGGVVSSLGLDLGVGVLAVVRVLGNDNMASASCGGVSSRNKRKWPGWR